MSALLPRTDAQFRSSKFWDKFFEAREGNAFEWYGKLQHILPFTTGRVAPTDRVLVVGCGNSELSADLYDTGVTRVTNIDYSAAVIEDMRAQHQEKRPDMDWRVMDMRDLSAFGDGSFDVVFDKGSFDALVATNDTAAEEDAARMLSEIARTLVPGGRYFCVTLAQPFVCRALSENLAVHAGALDIRILLGAGGGSGHVPFLFVATTRKTEAHAGLSISCFFQENGCPSAAAAPAESTEALGQSIQSAQEACYMRWLRNDCRTIKQDRFERVDLCADRRGAADPDPGGDPEPGPRFTLMILDVSSSAPQGVSVFIVPQGREHEYLFATQEGLLQIAESAACCRLIAVTLNRGHRFESLESVQSELSPVILDFAPKIQSQKIPFMTTDESIGNRTVLARGKLDSGERYYVEETAATEGLLRRLIFEENRNVIQTEVRLAAPGAGGAEEEGDGFAAAVVAQGGGGGCGKKGKSRGKSGGAKKKKKKAKEINSTAETEAETGAEQGPAARVDFTYLCFEYHAAMLAGMSLSEQLHAAPQSSSMLVVGLGGGALPMVLRHFFPQVRLVVCELDSQVYAVAREWFGLATGPQLEVHIGDGLRYLQDLAAAAEAPGLGADAKLEVAHVVCALVCAGVAVCIHHESMFFLCARRPLCCARWTRPLY